MIPNWINISQPTKIVVNCFQNCIFTYDSQHVDWVNQRLLVVNCFQNCIFTYDSQHISIAIRTMTCCELLSELYFYLWFPTELKKFIKEDSLWIAFRIVFLLMIPNIINQICKALEVVNCFQNCIFTYDSQHIFANRIDSNGCELLSELYFYLWFPTKAHLVTWLNQLWIAFRIVFLLMIPNLLLLCLQARTVVNCFQNCIFTYDSQRKYVGELHEFCCELLSELYFYLWFPTFLLLILCLVRLWIAFRIVFLLMIPNNKSLVGNTNAVVNCFQNCIFTYDSQPEQSIKHSQKGCELLSELYFYLWFPTNIV